MREKMTKDITIGVQYYRPPFPDRTHWKNDLRLMADSGMHAVQLWLLWGWIESKPGIYRFEDYDELMAEADRVGLKVVLSTIAAIHPCWIHREEPGSEMVTNFGHTVISSHRRECNHGLSPGGCMDHPGVWERMRKFLEACARQYQSASNLVGWDVWNELRWNVHADGLVCYCPHTIARYRSWLDTTYGGLDGLNRAWKRRYGAWDEVPAGKLPRSPYTEVMAFQRFLTWRSNRHAADRYQVVKAIDPERPVTVHGDAPSILRADDPENTALHRGNDWHIADHVDGIGTSSFPLTDPRNYFVRIDCTAAAAVGKRIWLSEVQGGRAAWIRDATPVRARDQQKWLWGGISRGAEAILFWCWRDEVFGIESGGYGMIGADGFAEERLDAFRQTREVLDRHGNLLSAFVRDPAKVGILFHPDSYYLDWSEGGSADSTRNGVLGYAQAMVENNIPYTFVESGHLDDLHTLRILFLPRCASLSDETMQTLVPFVENGGTLFMESETGAFNEDGFYRDTEDRLGARLTGCPEIGRRILPDNHIKIRFKGELFELPAAQWVTPMRVIEGETLADHPDGSLCTTSAIGKGKVVICGTFLGDAYLNGATGVCPEWQSHAERFVDFIAAICAEDGILPAARAEHGAHVTVGHSGARRMAFVFSKLDNDPETIEFPKGTFGDEVEECMTSQTVEVENTETGQRLAAPPGPWNISVIADQENGVETVL